MNFASVCSGIEAASQALVPLGWQCAFVAEIEPFPCAVLKHHYPETPNYGDLTKFKEWPVRPIDVLIGGTPCQSFSVAGLRKGLDDPRGNLALTFLAVVERFAPTWVVFENVPGLLSVDGGRVFGAFLGGLGQLGYGTAYCVLDAQHFGVPQRRRRVFVVGHIGGQWQRAAAVLFKRESLSGNFEARRPERQGATHPLAPCIGASGRGFERTGDTRGQDAVIPINMQAAAKNGKKSPNMLGIGQPGDPAFTCNASDQHAIAHSLRADGFDGNATGRNTPKVQTQMAVRRLSPTECARLMGFPDDWLDIDFRGKPATDGHKYRAYGNSMAVPVVHWIGRRIESVSKLCLNPPSNNGKP